MDEMNMTTEVVNTTMEVPATTVEDTNNGGNALGTIVGLTTVIVGWELTKKVVKKGITLVKGLFSKKKDTNAEDATVAENVTDTEN